MPLTPIDLSFPSKFPSWRPGQYQSLERALATDKRFIAQAAPTGFGKSLFMSAFSVLSGGRSVIDTSTKALQDQYMDDFQSCGMRQLRGRQNYPCDIANNCKDGAAYACDSPSCAYLYAMEAFKQSHLNVTNYACHLSNVIHSEGIGQVRNLGLDEAHNAIQEVCAALEIRLNHKANSTFYNATGTTPPYRQELPAWRDWAKDFSKKLSAYIAGLKSGGDLDRETRVLISHGNMLLRSLAILSTAPDGWIVDEHTSPGETILSPVWPMDLTDRYLFGGAEKVVLMSATLVPKTLQLLGIDPANTLYMDHATSFDSNRSPVYIFANSRIDSKSGPGVLDEWVARMDLLIGKRLDRKGIIHSTSYENQEIIYRNSAYQYYMITHTKEGFAEALREFVSSPAPRILVTPSATTGYDFPGTICEYQILGKVPFIDKRPPLMAARDASDKEYLPYLTAQTMVQTCGRAMRFDTDRCENFIMDAHAKWFFRTKDRRGYRHLFPSWFLRQVRYTDQPPQPPAPLSVMPSLSGARSF